MKKAYWNAIGFFIVHLYAIPPLATHALSGGRPMTNSTLSRPRHTTLAAALETLIPDRCNVSYEVSNTDRDTSSTSALADPFLKT
jgi:hypothetical protein